MGMEQSLDIPWVMHRGMQVHVRLAIGVEGYVAALQELEREVFRGQPWTWRPVFAGNVPASPIAKPGPLAQTLPQFLIEAFSVAVPVRNQTGTNDTEEADEVGQARNRMRQREEP
jgi:hypothetical protein